MTWSIVQSDAIAFLNSLETDAADLLFTSPPYELARTYGIGDKMVGGQAWVDWMVAVVKAAAPKVKGLIAIVCEGQTRKFRYTCTPFLLVADLHRAGFCLRKPAVFRRVGIPGSGGPDWLRNDWEPIVCITRSGKLPWSDNKACGHPPKWAPGGEMSHRLTDGTRTNQWGKCGTEAGCNGTAQRTRDGGRQKAKRPSHVMLTKSSSSRRRQGTDKKENFGHDGNGEVKGAHARDIVKRKVMTRKREGQHNQEQFYTQEAIANPGNVTNQTYTAQEVAHLMGESADVIDCKVGGGLMGHDLAHENEAPFPLTLAEFFVRSFCPPGGLVIDPFSGSGTTAHAAKKWGRSFAGCDLRESQVELTRRRIADVMTELFV